MNFNHDTGQVDSILTLDTTIAPPLGGTTGSLMLIGTGALGLPAGSSAQQPSTPSFAMLRGNSSTSSLEFYNGATWSALSTVSGTVSSVSVAGGTGISSSGSPITSSGTITLTLSTELQGLSGLSTTGLMVRTGAGTYATTAIAGTAGDISIVNGSGVSGAPTLDLISVGTPVTNLFQKFTTDSKGRVTATSAVIAADITASLGYTPVNRAGDTMSGNLTFTAGTVTGVATPTNASDVATKQYVDMTAQGLDIKQSVDAATTAADGNINIATPPASIDGRVLVSGDRILLKNQSIASQNGIYVYNGTTLARANDMTGTAITSWSGSTTYVEAGTLNAKTFWTVTTVDPITLGTSNITWTQFGGPGTYSAGTGLNLTGTTFSLITPVAQNLGGTGLASIGTANQILGVNAGASGLEYKSVVSGTGVSVVNTAGTITVNNTGVTSVAVTGSTGLAVSGSPITTTGTISLTLGTELQGLSGLAALGLVARTGAGTYVPVTITGTTNQITVTNGNGTGAPTIAIAANPVLPGTSGVVLPSGTTAQRPAATAAMMRYNQTTSTFEKSNGIVWINDGTVTSVALSGGTTGLTVSGGPITGSGTLTLAGTIVTANGGTGLTSIGTANQVLAVNTGASGLEYKTITGGTGISVNGAAGTLTIANTGVTSVALSMPSIFTISGSPVTTTGTLTASLTNQATNTIFAGPNGSTGAPTFRALAYADLPIKLYVENSVTPTAPTAAGTNAVAIGSGAAAAGSGAMAVGSGAAAVLYGSKAFASGSFTAAGDAQHGVYVLRNITNNTTATELFLDGSAATQRLVVPNNSVVTFSITVAGRRTDATGGGAGYRLEGVIRKDATAASTTFVGTPSRVILGETNAVWNVSVAADTTNGSLSISVIGENAKTVRWVATVQTTEVTN